MNERPDPNAGRLEALDAATLTPMVQQALEDSSAWVTDWTVEVIRGGFGGGLGGTYLYRFRGHAQADAEVKEWSVVLKVIQARPDSAPDSTHYWKREYLLSQSDLLKDVPGRLSTFRTFGGVEYADEACWIWMEDLVDARAGTWPLEHYGTAARHLGQFNGAYLTGRAIPNELWLCKNWVRQIAKTTEGAVPRIHQMLNSPPIRAQFPPDSEAQFDRMWADRERFLTALEGLPQTFAHQDPVRGNLFTRRGMDGGYETVAIDWAFAGPAAIGMDAAVLLIIGLTFREFLAAAAPEAERLIFDQYVLGLRDAGWNGDERSVRLGFLASATCKYFEMLLLGSQFMADPAQSADVEAMLGYAYDDIVREFSGVFQFAMRLTEEARQLMREVG